MSKLKFMAAALIVAAMLAAPAMARESAMGTRHLAANASESAMPRGRSVGEAEQFRGSQGHDVWGHWGSYYGPMLPSNP
jgi:hypothetical protein